MKKQYVGKKQLPKPVTNYYKHVRRKTITKPQIAIISLLLVLALVFFALLFFEDREKEASGESINIFFLDSASYTLKPETRTMPKGDDAAKVKFALEELSIGSRSASLLQVTPQGVIKSATIEGDNVDVSLTSSYNDLKADEKIILRAALAMTLTDLPFVETITLNVNGTPLSKENGHPISKISKFDIIMTPEFVPENKSLKTLTLYFANGDGTSLVAEERTLSININETIEMNVVDELLKGPADKNMQPTIPKGVKVLDVRTADGICSVDMSKEFITKHTGNEEQIMLTIYSIVNSLSELSDVKNVQFLIEGERQEYFKTVSGFNSLYEAVELK